MVSASIGVNSSINCTSLAGLGLMHLFDLQPMSEMQPSTLWLRKHGSSFTMKATSTKASCKESLWRRPKVRTPVPDACLMQQHSLYVNLRIAIMGLIGSANWPLTSQYQKAAEPTKPSSKECSMSLSFCYSSILFCD